MMVRRTHKSRFVPAGKWKSRGSTSIQAVPSPLVTRRQKKEKFESFSSIFGVSTSGEEDGGRFREENMARKFKGQDQRAEGRTGKEEKEVTYFFLGWRPPKSGPLWRMHLDIEIPSFQKRLANRGLGKGKSKRRGKKCRIQKTRWMEEGREKSTGATVAL